MCIYKLQKKYLWVGPKVLDENGLLGEGVTRQKFKLDDKFQVFVRSRGSGARHLAAHTCILIDDDLKEVWLIY